VPRAHDGKPGVVGSYDTARSATDSNAEMKPNHTHATLLRVVGGVSKFTTRVCGSVRRWAAGAGGGGVLVWVVNVGEPPNTCVLGGSRPVMMFRR
jgi:hypothetical protein